MFLMLLKAFKSPRTIAIIGVCRSLTDVYLSINGRLPVN